MVYYRTQQTPSSDSHSARVSLLGGYFGHNVYQLQCACVPLESILKDVFIAIYK